MAYADFTGDDRYTSKVSGAALEVIFINETDPADVIIGAVASFNLSNDFEVIPIEEAGEDGVDEIAQGRHTGNGSVTAFFTPEWNDKLPTRQSMIGKGYTVIRRWGEDHGGDFVSTVLDACTGVRISRIGSQHGARGAITFDIAFAFERHYNGTEYAALTGT